MPGTVKFREAIKQDDGTYKPGEVISDCNGHMIHRKHQMNGSIQAKQ